MDATIKRPSYQFYPSDWRNDLALRACSIAARGLWQELLVTMHLGTPYGHLALDGVPLSDAESAALAGVPEKLYKQLIAELERRKVFSRTEEGVLYSRRLVRDEEKRNRRAKGGEDGAEHGHKGAEHGKKGGRPRKERGDNKPPFDPPTEGGSKTPLRGSPKPPPSSSSSVSSSLPPTAAAAAVSPPDGVAAAAASDVPDAVAYAERRDAVRARFTDERHLLAFDRHVRASQFPDAFLLDVEAASRERPSDGAPGLPWDVIGTVLHELSVKGKRPTEHMIRVFGEPIVRPAPAPSEALSGPISGRVLTEAEEEAEILRRIEAGEFLPADMREVTRV